MAPAITLPLKERKDIPTKTLMLPLIPLPLRNLTRRRKRRNIASKQRVNTHQVITAKRRHHQPTNETLDRAALIDRAVLITLIHNRHHSARDGNTRI